MKKTKLVLLNDQCPEIDLDINGPYYEKENHDTSVVYQIENFVNGKSYIGRAVSYHKSGSRHGAIGRFKSHWNNKDYPRNDCPVFYEDLRKSDILDWFVYTLKVCPRGDAKQWETKFIKEYNTSDPEYGYNYFVGNNKPSSKEHAAKYQESKATSNAKRAIGGKMKRVEHNKNLPEYISYCEITDRQTTRKGYMARIKFNGTIYKKIFTSMKETMEFKFEQAKKYIETVKSRFANSEENKEIQIPRGQARSEINKNLPHGVTCILSKDDKSKKIGYCASLTLNGRRYKKVFTAQNESMKSKLNRAIKQIYLFKKEAKKNNSGSKTNKK